MDDAAWMERLIICPCRVKMRRDSPFFRNGTNAFARLIGTLQVLSGGLDCLFRNNSTLSAPR